MKKKDADPFGLINAEDFFFFGGRAPEATSGFLLLATVGWLEVFLKKFWGLDFFLLYYMKNMYGLEIVEYNFIPGRVRA